MVVAWWSILFMALWPRLGPFLHVSSEIHVGTFCTKHADCIRYCAYSKYGPEGASCCFPEKIRISKSNWLETGSHSCYCCPSNNSKVSGNVFATPMSINSMKNQTEHTDLCQGYLNNPSVSHDDVNSDFCRNGRCIQAMVIMKMAFEYPSICRAKKFPHF